MPRELHYHWEYSLKANREKLWPFVSDTNRFNRDTGVPSIEVASTVRGRLRNARQRLRLSMYGMAVEWEEQPFEWIRPSRFGVSRSYSKGPVVELRALAEMLPRSDDGTQLSYDVHVTPRSFVGALLVRIQMKFSSAHRFAKAFEKYDELASMETEVALEETIELGPAAVSRLQSIREKLLAEGADEPTVDRLINFIGSADDFLVARMRPYQLADKWDLRRRTVLEACLLSTRLGLLDLQWELLCPLCRGPGETGSSLSEISSQVHCETCRIDFTVNFDRFVELTFRPNALLRPVQLQDFCMGSPQKTPHIVAQQLLPAGSNRPLALPLEPGRYRFRALELAGGQDVIVSEDAPSIASVTISEVGWPAQELRLSQSSVVDMQNNTNSEQLLILERIAWSDQAATAAEVTALQIFRDLFSSEALRPGEQISVGTLTVLFTDLRDSTRLYREIGDATAFGRVMNHFDVLKKVIAQEDGALVKTIGDAVMAVFREPVSALRAMLSAQQQLAAPADGSAPLRLKAGVHTGPCIAVTLNERLDYFGSTVNMAARLEGLSTADDVIISRPMYDDPEVRNFIEAEKLQTTAFEMRLKGFEEERFELLRVSRRVN